MAGPRATTQNYLLAYGILAHNCCAKPA
ncbi:hypothetical protein [Hymenobacter sp. B1770]